MTGTDDSAASAALAAIIRREIAAAGAISFARFMELALYHPEFGYYERGSAQVGQAGDFYTSVIVGPLFGELLASEFARRLESLGGDCELVEGGAHDGQLARDILSHLAEFHEEIFRRTRYVILEPSRTRADWQAEKLQAFRGKVRWARDWSEAGKFRGICFSNELLDAMPTHVFRWDAAALNWAEWGVASCENDFHWTRLPPNCENGAARALLPVLPAELQKVLPEQFTLEVSPQATAWWQQAARQLSEGWLLTADYGGTQEELLDPRRASGTLRAYRAHHYAQDPLASPGFQDLTAHVNFSATIQAGQAYGLALESLNSQSQFLKSILDHAHADPASFPSWTPARRRQLMTLLHPEHLGRAFRFLAMSRPPQSA